MYEEQFPPPASPRPFGEIPGLWTKVFQMTEQFFAQEAPRASGSNTLISVLIMGVVSSVLATISSLIWGGTQMAFLPPEYREAMAVGAGSNLVCSLCSTLIGTAIGFYLGNGLVYLGARIFGGTGDFTTQAYLTSLFAVPVGIVAGLVGLVPCVGLIAVLAVGIYALVLNVRAVKVAHNLTTGQAVAAVFVPAVVIGVLVACLAVVGLAILGPAISNVFENIVTNLE
jgi:hypothetical protein